MFEERGGDPVEKRDGGGLGGQETAVAIGEQRGHRRDPDGPQEGDQQQTAARRVAAALLEDAVGGRNARSPQGGRDRLLVGDDPGQDVGQLEGLLEGGEIGHDPLGLVPGGLGDLCVFRVLGEKPRPDGVPC